MSGFKAPENFNFERPQQWPEWKQRFQRFFTLSKYNKEDGELQVSSLVYAMGREAEHIMKSFHFPDEDKKKDFEFVLKQFDNHFIPKRNVIHERACFNKRSQQPGESVEAFIRHLYELAEYCDFGDKKGEYIRDRIVTGIQDQDLAQRLQMEAKLDLETAVQMARNSEMIKSQGADRGTTNLDEVRGAKPKRNNSRSGYQNSNHGNRGRRQGGSRSSVSPAQQQGHNNSSTQNCGRCGYPKHTDGSKCPARYKRCMKCHKIGHFQHVCRTRDVNEVTDKTDCEAQDCYFLGSVTCNETDAWYVSLVVGGKPVTFKIDTGADISLIYEDTYDSLPNKPKLCVTSRQLDSPGGELSCIGEFEADTFINNEAYSLRVIVVGGHGSNLLSRGVASAMGLVTHNCISHVTEIHNDVFGDIGLLQCEPVKIALKKDAVPYSLSTARRVPFPLLPKVEAELKRMVKDGIIEEVTQPTEWCAPMVPVVKRNNKIRICVDLKKLNVAVKRERYILPTFEDIIPKLNGARYFSKLDASSGFHQIPLDPDSSLLTTFITPVGRFCFKRVPFGITSAPEIFQRKMCEVLKGLEGSEAIMDDVLIWGRTAKEHDDRLNSVLERVESSGLKLNREKCEIRKSSITYFGHVISEHGVKPDPAKTQAIRDLSTPTDITELRRAMGMINYLGRFLPDLSSVLRPMSDLLKSDAVFIWGPAQDAAFLKVKEMLTSPPVLQFYDLEKPTVVSADASSYGLGATLLQQHADKLLPVAFCSRTLTAAETRYSQIEKECLASVWACERFARYLYGLESFRLLTDHKPLVPLINKTDLDRAPIRCTRLLMRLMRFNPVAEHVAGKNMVVADMLSRAPLNVGDEHSTAEIQSLVEEIEAYTESVIETKPMSDQKLKEIQDATTRDKTLQLVMSLTSNGWPAAYRDVPLSARAYYSVRGELSVSRNILLYRDRIVVPEAMRADILDRIHEGHQGLTKCRERAGLSVWWPELNQHIQEKVSTCVFCQTNQSKQRKEPLQPTTLPDRPWQKIAADLCDCKGQQYLVVIDYFSRFLEVVHLKDTTSKGIIGKLKCLFSRWGIPEELVTDNGPQFVSHVLVRFKKEYGFKHTTSSPHFPQANGMAEAGVKIAKHALKQADPFLALLSYRSTPVQSTGKSPAQLIMGRQLRGTIPMLEKVLQPKWPDFSAVRSSDKFHKESSRKFFDQHHCVKSLPVLKPGDEVRLQVDGEIGWKTPGVVQRCASTPRSYVIKTPKGNLRRNRRHLQLVPPGSVDITPECNVYLPMQKFSVDTPKSVEQSVHCEQPEPSATLNPQESKTSSGRIVRKPQRFNDYV